MSAVAERRRWWQDAVFYEIYLRSFQDSDGDGVGDLDGIATRVDYLAGLGVDAVWITPFYPSPMADFGYDVADYCDVDPLFGSLAVLRPPVASALKARGIRTILDFVPNHTSDRHPWFVESRASRELATARLVSLARPGAGRRPAQQLAQPGSAARPGRSIQPRGQYYLHSFLPQQPDLNWRNPEVRRAMLDAMRFWLDRGVDGFRVDVDPGPAEGPAFRDDPPNPHYRAGDPAYMTLDPVNSSNQARGAGDRGGDARRPRRISRRSRADRRGLQAGRDAGRLLRQGSRGHRAALQLQPDVARLDSRGRDAPRADL